AGFLIVEFGLTVLLVSAVGLSFETFRRAQGPAARIDRDHLLTLRLAASAERYSAPAARRDLYDRLLDRIAAVPGVTAVSFTSTPALAGPPNQVEREGDAPVPETNRLMVPAISVDAAYFRALGLPLASGRSFDGGGDRAGAREVVANERLAHVLFPEEDAIGRRVRVAPQRAKDAPLRTIVGIAPNLRQAPGSAPDPIVYLPFDAS